MACKCAKPTDQWHGWECDVTGGECLYLFPDSKACAKDYGEGPDVKIDKFDPKTYAPGYIPKEIDDMFMMDTKDIEVDKDE